MNVLVALVLYAVGAFGFAYIVGFSKISLPMRLALETEPTKAPPLAYYVRATTLMLLECPACLGFWFGLIYGWLHRPEWVTPLGLALFTCGSNYLLARFAGLLDEVTDG